jgi:hypothetical protein
MPFRGHSKTMNFWKKLFRRNPQPTERKGGPERSMGSTSIPRSTGTPQRARIFSAVQSGNVASLQQCLRDGDDINATDKDGQTPLHTAASAPNPEMCIFLIFNGANVNAKSKLGSTPLDIAATMFLTLVDGSLPDLGKPYLKVCVILFEHGARPSSNPSFARINKILSSLPAKEKQSTEDGLNAAGKCCSCGKGMKKIEGSMSGASALEYLSDRSFSCKGCGRSVCGDCGVRLNWVCPICGGSTRG